MTPWSSFVYVKEELEIMQKFSVVIWSRTWRKQEVHTKDSWLFHARCIHNQMATKMLLGISMLSTHSQILPFFAADHKHALLHELILDIAFLPWSKPVHVEWITLIYCLLFFLPFAVDWKPWDYCLQHLWKMDTKSMDLVYCCTSQLRTSINFEYDEWCIAQTVCELRTWKENSIVDAFECQNMDPLYTESELFQLLLELSQKLRVGDWIMRFLFFAQIFVRQITDLLHPLSWTDEVTG